MTTGRPAVDALACQEWCFPNNDHHQFRAYQHGMAASAIFSNCLVSLPTGMGKTLIAAVVVKNYMRFFPEGAVVFMAPTRPLVQQQVSATRYMRRACQIQVLRLLLSGRRWSRVVQCHSRGS